MTSIAKKSLLFLAAAFISAAASAHRVSFEGLSESVFMDIPEEFALADTQGNSSFLLQNKIIPASAIVKFHENGKFPSAEEAVETTLRKLNAKATDSRNAPWRNNMASLAKFSAVIAGRETEGYAAAAEIPETKGFAVLLAWCPVENFQRAGCLLESFIDSLCIDSESLFSPGLFTSLYRPDSGTKQDVCVLIDGKKIQSQMDSAACENSEYLIEREYKVLQLYINSGMAKEAWQRYYRMIFKDSCKRLQQVSFDIYREIAPACKDETDFAQKILTWTQGFKYTREKTASDFSSLPSIIAGEPSDCDSRSMMIAVILQSTNIDAILFVSNEYEHAIAGLSSSHPGFGFNVEGRYYLTGETTVRGMTWGIIDQSQSDFSKWIPVILP
ncbi:hypothetical protein [Treponema sp.]|uniref:hypothetical protein n=1 Tax=Treponema sp. TaxID=166 RepID=UPI003F030CA6